MRLANVGLVLLPLCLTACAAFPQRDLSLAGVGTNADMRLASARSYEQQGDYERAKQLYQELLAQDPKSPVVLHRLGILAVRQGALNEGLEQLELARTLAPSNAELLTDIGYTLYLQGRMEESAGALQNALNLDPDNKRCLNNLGLVLGKQGRMQDARGVFRQMGTEAESLAKVGYIHAQLGNLDEAEKSYSKALDEDSDLTVAAEALLQIAQQRKAKSKAQSAGQADSLAKAKAPSRTELSAVSGLEPLPSLNKATRTPRRLSPDEVASTPLKTPSDQKEDAEKRVKTAATIQQASYEASDRQGAHAYFTAPILVQNREPEEDANRRFSVRVTSAESVDDIAPSAATKPR